MLPMAMLRRCDCALAPTKAKVLAEAAQFRFWKSGRGGNADANRLRAAGAGARHDQSGQLSWRHGARLLDLRSEGAVFRGHSAGARLLFRERAIAGIEWVLPDRALAPESGSLSFAALDARQGAVADALGFPLPCDANAP